MKKLKIYKKIILILLISTMTVTLGRFKILATEENYNYGNLDTKSTLYSGNEIEATPKDKVDQLKVKSKLNSKLLQLTGKQAIKAEKTEEMLKDEMKSLNQFIPKGTFDKNIESVVPNDIVFVYIKTKTSEGVKIIKPYLYKIVSEDKANMLLTAWVDINALQQLEFIDEVLKIETVVQPKANIASEGDKLHRTNFIRDVSIGSTGTGIKIGVISDGVDHLNDSIAKGALNSQITVLSNKVGGDEGTAMLEIVHALVPGSALYFHDCGTDIIAFNQAVDNLIASGCNIIVDDISWITEPFFEDGIVSSHIKEVINKNGIVYVSSAGNSARNHYFGNFYNDGYNQNDFSSGKEPVYKYMYVHIEPGDTVQIVLQWDDSFSNSTNDYDLYLRNLNRNLIAASDVYQDGSGTSPLEYIEYTNSSSAAIDARIDIVNYEGLAAQKMLNLYIYGQAYENNIVSKNSIFGHAALSEVVTTGAVEVSAPNEIASYSSQGPVLYRNGITRQKPDVSGAAGVTVTGAGNFPSTFSGTSAASPHIAAIAALLWSQYPTMTNTQIRDLIINNSVDLGTQGYDNIYGYGRADAYNSFMARFEGDFDKNDIINIFDLATISRNFNISSTNTSNWKPIMDLNKDGIIDIYDIVLVSRKIE